MTEVVNKTPVVLTIGHSTHPLEEFIHLLKTYAVTRLVDVRAFPQSRRYPQFNRGPLYYSLNAVGIGYTHLSGLGGRRQTRADSPNTGWQNASFQAFADYMQTPEFVDNLQTLLELARVGRVAVMCAEAVPWRCHRLLIADALVIRGIQVEHIMSVKRTYIHSLTSWAKVSDTQLTYPPKTESPDEEASK
jgi:uncharacterized protein (DUF488 family)